MDFTTFLQYPGIISVTKKLYISDSLGNFVDFSDPTEKLGTNRLISFDTISTNIDKLFRHFYNTTGTVVLRNNDYFFDKCFPDDTTKGWVLRRTDGTIANFLKSTNKVVNIFASKDYPIRVRLACEMQLPGFNPTEFVLGTFLFSSINTGLGVNAQVSVNSMIKILQTKKADTIKDGYNNWFKDTPIVYLIRKILEKAFGVYNPSTYKIEIPTSFKIPTFKELILLFNTSQFSLLGRSPNQIDTNADNEPDFFPDYGLIPRAVVYDSANKILYFGLDNEIWKLNVDSTSNGYMLWSYYTSIISTRCVEKLQIINGYLYIWSRDKWLHSSIEPYIEANTTMSITDSNLREKNEELRIINLSNSSNVQCYSENVYDTEFNYFPSIPQRHHVNGLGANVRYQMSSYNHFWAWLYGITSIFGNFDLAIEDLLSANYTYLIPDLEDSWVNNNLLKQFSVVDSSMVDIRTGVLSKNFFANPTYGFGYYIKAQGIVLPATPSMGRPPLGVTQIFGDYSIHCGTGIDSIPYRYYAYRYPEDPTKTQKLNQVNLPIPFRQRVFINCLGCDASINGTYGSDTYSSLQLIKVDDKNKVQTDVWAKFTDTGNPDSVHTQLSIKNPSIELSSGYYAGMCLRYINNNPQAHGYNLTINTAYDSYDGGFLGVKYGTQSLEGENENDIKFTFGQKGVSGVFEKTAQANPLLIRSGFWAFGTYAQELLNEIWANEYSWQVGHNLLCNLGDDNGVTNAYKYITYSTIQLYTINPSTGVKTSLREVKLDYKGIEIQPTCFASTSTGVDDIWIFGYSNENLRHFGGAMGSVPKVDYTPYGPDMRNSIDAYFWPDSTSVQDAAKMSMGNNFGGLPLINSDISVATKQHRSYVFRISTAINGFNSATIDDVAINNKPIDSTNHFPLCNFRITTTSEIAATLPGAKVKVTPVSGGGFWDILITDCVLISETTYDIYYKPWGLYAKSLSQTSGYLPAGDFRNTTLYVVAYLGQSILDKVVLENVVYGNRIYCAILNLDKIGSATQYSLSYFDSTNFTTAPVSLDLDMSNQPKNFQLGASGKLYFTLEGSGQVAYIDLSSGNNATIKNSYTLMSEGDYAVSGEVYTHGEIALITDSGEQAIIYGYSSPSGRDRTQAKIFAGKYNTWKLATDYIPLVEFADFTDMSCDEALDAMIQAISWTKGFDEFGNYFQMKKELETTPSLTLKVDEGNKFIKITKKIDYESVANRITIIPYTATLQSQKWTVYELNRLPNEKLNLDISVEQKDTSRKTIVLNCIRDGALSIEYWSFTNSGSVEDFNRVLRVEDIEKAPLFAYNIVDPVIEGRICVEAAPSATKLYLDSVFGGNAVASGVHTNDYIKITDSTSGTFIKKITIVDATDNSITIESAFGITIKITTIVEFLRTQSNFFSNVYVTRVSKDVIVSTEIPVDSNKNLGINNIVEFSSASRNIVRNKYTDSDGQDWISVDAVQTLDTGDTIKAYWSPLKSETGYEIGGSNVILKLTATSDANPSNPMPHTFLKGESIIITCDGLKLEQDPYSSTTHIDVESSSIYGEIEFKNNVDNKFINRTLAKFLTKSIIDESATPRYELTVQLPYMPNLTPIADDKQKLRKIQVISQDLFLAHLDYAVNCGIVDIKQQVDKRSTIAILRGENRL